VTAAARDCGALAAMLADLPVDVDAAVLHVEQRHAEIVDHATPARP